MTSEFLHNPHHLQSYSKLALQKRHYYHHRSHHKTQVEVRCPKQSGKERQCHVLHSLSLYFTVSQQVFQANTAPSCGRPEAPSHSRFLRSTRASGSAQSHCCTCSKPASNKCIAVRTVATPLQELTCHMGSHSVTCHLAEVTFPPLPQPKLVLD